MFAKKKRRIERNILKVFETEGMTSQTKQYGYDDKLFVILINVGYQHNKQINLTAYGCFYPHKITQTFSSIHQTNNNVNI